jgi:hypothetical protein
MSEMDAQIDQTQTDIETSARDKRGTHIGKHDAIYKTQVDALQDLADETETNAPATVKYVDIGLNAIYADLRGFAEKGADYIAERKRSEEGATSDQAMRSGRGGEGVAEGGTGSSAGTETITTEAGAELRPADHAITGKGLQMEGELDSQAAQISGSLKFYEEKFNAIAFMDSKIASSMTVVDEVWPMPDLALSENPEIREKIEAALKGEYGLCTILKFLNSDSNLPKEYTDAVGGQLKEKYRTGIDGLIEGLRKGLVQRDQYELVKEKYSDLVDFNIPKSPIPWTDAGEALQPAEKERIKAELEAVSAMHTMNIMLETCPPYLENFWMGQQLKMQGDLNGATEALQEFLATGIAAMKGDPRFQAQAEAYKKQAEDMLNDEGLLELREVHKEYFEADNYLREGDYVNAKKSLKQYLARPFLPDENFEGQARETLKKIAFMQLDKVKKQFAEFAVPDEFKNRPGSLEAIVNASTPQERKNPVPMSTVAATDYLRIALNLKIVEDALNSGQYTDFDEAAKALLGATIVDLNPGTRPSLYDTIEDEVMLNEGRPGLLKLAQKYHKLGKGKTEMARMYFREYFAGILNAQKEAMDLKSVEAKYLADGIFQDDVNKKLAEAKASYEQDLEKPWQGQGPRPAWDSVQMSVRSNIERLALDNAIAKCATEKTQGGARFIPSGEKDAWDEWMTMEGKQNLDNAVLDFFTPSEETCKMILDTVLVELPIMLALGAVSGGAAGFVRMGLRASIMAASGLTAETVEFSRMARLMMLGSQFATEASTFTLGNMLVSGVRQRNYDNFTRENFLAEFSTNALFMGVLQTTGAFCKAAGLSEVESMAWRTGAFIETNRALGNEFDLSSALLLGGMEFSGAVRGGVQKVGQEKTVNELKRAPKTEVSQVEAVTTHLNLGSVAVKMADMAAKIKNVNKLSKKIQDNIPVFRAVDRRYAGMPDKRGENYWSVGSANREYSEIFVKNNPGYVLIESTIGELRRVGDVQIHADGTKLYLRNFTGRPAFEIVAANNEKPPEISAGEQTEAAPQPVRTRAEAMEPEYGSQEAVENTVPGGNAPVNLDDPLVGIRYPRDGVDISLFPSMDAGRMLLTDISAEVKKILGEKGIRKIADHEPVFIEYPPGDPHATPAMESLRGQVDKIGIMVIGTTERLPEGAPYSVLLNVFPVAEVNGKRYRILGTKKASWAKEIPAQIESELNEIFVPSEVRQADGRNYVFMPIIENIEHPTMISRAEYEDFMARLRKSNIQASLSDIDAIDPSEQISEEINLVRYQGRLYLSDAGDVMQGEFGKPISKNELEECATTLRGRIPAESPPEAKTAAAKQRTTANESKAGASLLHERDSRLHTTQPVEHEYQRRKRSGEKPSQKPKDRIADFIAVIERTHSHNEDPRVIERIKKYYQKQHVIRAENIPTSYWELQRRIYRERGEGDVEITDEMKRQHIEAIIADQKSSLDAWVSYLSSADANAYPTWAKYWVFREMLKLGKYDKGKKAFGKRTKDTVVPFAELNREALAYVVDIIVQRANRERIPTSENNPELQKLIQGLNFGKLYIYALEKATPEEASNLQKTEGQWVRYPKNSDHTPLVKSLQGHGTGWCTAGESTARQQLKGGDFYVYYSLDTSGNPTVPRVAIRMEGNNIGEVRGIADNQNLDPYIGEVTKQKLAEFPDGKDYEKKVNDMKTLTDIENKNKAGQVLTMDELKFLYEIDGNIQGFGYEKDPRIAEIIRTRDVKSDLSLVTGYPKDQISTTKEEALSGRKNIHHGDIDLHERTSAERLVFPQTVIGDIDLSSITSAKGLTLPQTMNGNLVLSGLKSAEGLILPQTMNGDLLLMDLKSAKGLILPETVGGDLLLGDLKSLEGVKLPKHVGGNLDLKNLTSAEGLELPRTVGGYLQLNSLESADGLIFPQTVGDLNLGDLKSAKGAELPETVNGDLDLWYLDSAEGVKLPRVVTGRCNLGGLSSTKGLKLPDTVGGLLGLNHLTSAEGLEFPQTVNGDIHLNGLTSARGLKLPQTMNGGLHLSGLTSAEGLTLPITIGGDLDISGLTSTEGLRLPSSVGGKIIREKPPYKRRR